MVIRHCVLSAEYIFNEELVTSLMKNEGYTRNEATRKDFAMNFRDIASRFAYEVYCITELYSRLLEKVKTDDTRQISVLCIKEITDDRVLNLLGAKNIQIQYDIRDFFALRSMEKRKKALSLLMEGIQKVATQSQWDSAPFDRAHDAVIEQGYINHRIWKKVSSPNRKMYAELLLQLEVEAMNIVATIRGKKNGEELCRKTLVTTKPDSIHYNLCLGTFKWESNTKVTLTAKHGDAIWDGDKYLGTSEIKNSWSLEMDEL